MAIERWATIALLVAGLLHSACAANTYTVGDGNGWVFPPNGIATFFDDWAKQHMFYPGDSLLFPFVYGFHNVEEVSQADVESCSSANPIATYTQTNSTVLLSRTGYYGFICGMASHCAGNMKMNLYVVDFGTIPGGGPSAGPASGPSETATGRASGLQFTPAIVLAALSVVASTLFW